MCILVPFGAEINTLELDVGNRANLPANTTIGNATPEDVANAIYFLASNESSYITGEVLQISGGVARY